jgi:hypothetical protein
VVRCAGQKKEKKNNPTPRHAWRALARVKSRGHLRGDAIASRASFGAAEKAAGGVVGGRAGGDGRRRRQGAAGAQRDNACLVDRAEPLAR